MQVEWAGLPSGQLLQPFGHFMRIVGHVLEDLGHLAEVMGEEITYTSPTTLDQRTWKWMRRVICKPWGDLSSLQQEFRAGGAPERSSLPDNRLREPERVKLLVALALDSQETVESENAGEKYKGWAMRWGEDEADAITTLDQLYIGIKSRSWGLQLHLKYGTVTTLECTPAAGKKKIQPRTPMPEVAKIAGLSNGKKVGI